MKTTYELFDVTTMGLDYGGTDDENITITGGSLLSPVKALAESLNAVGAVDMDRMQRTSGLTVEQIVKELRGKAILQEPTYFKNKSEWTVKNGWVSRFTYCNGNVIKKLFEAREAEKRFPGCFQVNIDVLENMLPEPLALEDIHVSLGATWVPAEIYAEFIMKLLGLKNLPKVYYNAKLSKWEIEEPEEIKFSVANKITYGTPNMPAIKIIKRTMNVSSVKVFDYLYHYSHYGKDFYERILNAEETLVVQENQKLIIEEFNKWIFQDTIRRYILEDCYNDVFVGYAKSHFDGSFLELADLNPNITLYKHQKDAIARIILSESNVLLAHDVGTGKTYEMIVGVHELKRMNLSNSNLVVVPNNVLQDVVDAHKLLYPNDKILAVFPKDFTPKYRKAVLEDIRDGDYTAVYMAYSSFDMIVMSKKYWINKWANEIRILHSLASESTRKSEVKALHRESELLSKKLAKFIETAVDTPWLTFDQLGINTLVVDEAHNYKNIPLYSRADNIVGMHNKGSKKCAEMLEKAHFSDRVIFATGTPLTNSLADLFVIQSYLQHEELKFRGIDSFDMWVNCFGERETNFEIDVDGSGFREMTRFSTFHNLTELMSLFSSVCDFYHTDFSDAELPKYNGCENICVPKSEKQGEYISSLAERTERIRKGEISRTEDNLLKVTVDGRKCALDVRLTGADADSGETKIDACAKQVYKIYKAYPETCQIIFSDIGTPKSAFNIYDCLKQKLVSMGIRNDEIAFVHDATTETARKKLFSAMNLGKLRVVIGSTQKLGVGVNVQERLIALHHLSVPWKPADVLQREGRIIRRGNTCEEVFIYRYITEGSFDSYSWQLLENKQRFISSFLSGTLTYRELGDIADSVLTYAEVKALAIGNPLIKKRIETSNKLERLRISSRQRQEQLIVLRSFVENSPDQIRKISSDIYVIEQDFKDYMEAHQSISKAERIAFGEELIASLNENEMQPKERVFDQYQGFTVVLPANMMNEAKYVILKRNNGRTYTVVMNTDKPLGCTQRIDYVLDHLPEQIIKLQRRRKTIEQQYEEALKDIDAGNSYNDEILAVTEELAQIDNALAEMKETS